ncbi:phosphatidylserine decarboxylase [Wolbachia endosymbiont of Pentidionis agamae]|uniref:phosphatidylserine decarboxylase n=1 Tax=Wolbachia endosymbiont of Pentidionis agamae TaxID=3110435 RepID=UPI002FD4C1F4
MCFSLPNVNKEGYIFIISAFIISCIAFSISWGFGVTCLFPTLLCVYFFRDPARSVPKDENLILSPADGTILKIEQVNHQSLGRDEKFTCISIFLSVLNVHVNRIPIYGIIKEMEYRKGKFISAANNKSSNENEKQVIVIEHQDGQEIIVEQIAGFIARRIVCNLKVSQDVKAGERFGIIRFGSRVNIYIPSNLEILVSEGQTVVGGETIIGNLSNEGAKKLVFEVI